MVGCTEACILRFQDINILHFKNIVETANLIYLPMCDKVNVHLGPGTSWPIRLLEVVKPVLLIDAGEVNFCHARESDDGFESI
jgi:hypothetical protein